MQPPPASFHCRYVGRYLALGSLPPFADAERDRECDGIYFCGASGAGVPAVSPPAASFAFADALAL